MFTQVPPFRPEAELEKVTAALQLLTQAKRPVIVAGGGVTASGARAELIALAEKLSIPVATSLNAKAMFPADHPLAVGVPGSYSRACANQALCEADLVFFIGSHTGGQVTNSYAIPPQGTPIIQLDINPEEIGRNYPIQVGMQGDARNTLRRMMEQAETVPARTEWTSRVQELVQSWKESVRDVANSDVEPMRPERLCKELTDYLPSDAILVSDTGHSGIWTGTMIDLKHPDQSYIRCSGSLGWGLPAAMGAKCAQPDRPVLCFTGDGGIWYHLSELETASEIRDQHGHRGQQQPLAEPGKGRCRADLRRSDPWLGRTVALPRHRFCRRGRIDGLFRHDGPQTERAFECARPGICIGQTGGGRCQDPHRRHCATSVGAGVMLV